MALFPLARPAWAQQLSRDPMGLVTALLVPLTVAVLAVVDGRPDRLPAMLALGWTLVGLLPGAVRGRSADPGLELRWRTQPFGAADRWSGAMATFVPMGVAGALLVTGVAWLVKAPPVLHDPGVFLVAALCAFATASWGVALGALSRRPWHRAGLLGLALVLSGWALLPGAGGPALLTVPAGQAMAAMQALPRGLGAASVPLIEMGLSTLAAVIAGVIGYGRR